MNKVNNFNLPSKYFFKLKSNFGNTLLNFDNNFNLKINDYFLKLKIKNKINNIFVNQNNFNLNKHYFDFTDNSRFLKIPFGQKLPLRIIKNNLLLTSNNNLFDFKFNNFNNTFSNKNQYSTNFLVLKQKKYTKKTI